VRSPTYIGATGAADSRGIEVAAVPSRDLAAFARDLGAVVAAIEARGKRARSI
jgi:hypothetical protein